MNHICRSPENITNILGQYKQGQEITGYQVHQLSKFVEDENGLPDSPCNCIAAEARQAIQELLPRFQGRLPEPTIAVKPEMPPKWVQSRLN